MNQKTNNVSVTFTQVQKQNVYGENGEVKEVKEHPVEATFEASTDNMLTAKNVGNWFIASLLNWQKLRPLQGLRGFQTSKLVSVSLKVGNKSYGSNIKFTTNIDRLEKSLGNTQTIVASLFAKQPTWKQLNNDKTVLNMITLAPEQVVIAKSKVEVLPDGQMEEKVEE